MSLFNDKKIKTITKNGKGAIYTVKRIRGRAFAFLTVEPGKKYNISVDYTQ